ncbi:MAG: family 16 glycosylhydrolase [Verrucomicrobiota bacterium]
MKFTLTILGLLLGLISSVLAGPPEGTEWVPFEGMTDEFEGERLDTDKWFDRNPDWIGRPPVFFHRNGVQVRNGKLHLKAFDAKQSANVKLPKDYTHVSGYVRSKNVVRFGYFEMRAKLMDASLVSCFWLSNHERREWSEIDIVEAPAGVNEYRRIIPINTHYFFGPHYPGTREKHLVTPKKVAIDFDPTADFHIYGVEWSSTKIAWYIDGEKVGEIENKWYYQPLRMSINIEANDWFKALPNDETLPNEYVIDWVRAWQPKNTFEPISHRE